MTSRREAPDAKPRTRSPGREAPDAEPRTPWLLTLPEVPSTNTWCLERWQALAHGAVVWTPRQTGGRGRGGKTWVSPPGVLTASFVLHLATAPGPLALAAGLAVLHAAEDLAPGLRCGIKWPNDVVVGRRKLAGVLVERPSPTVAVVGVGMNLAVTWEGDDAVHRTSLAEHGAHLSRDDASAVAAVYQIRRYLIEAAGLLRTGAFSALLPTIQERNILQGHHVTLTTPHGIRTGRCTGIDQDGQLLLHGIAILHGSLLAWDDHPLGKPRVLPPPWLDR